MFDLDKCGSLFNHIIVLPIGNFMLTFPKSSKPLHVQNIVNMAQMKLKKNIYKCYALELYSDVETYLMAMYGCPSTCDHIKDRSRLCEVA